jgi:hypothetical protein
MVLTRVGYFFFFGFFFFFLVVLGFELEKQALYLLTYISGSFCSGYFGEWFF